MLLSLLPNQLQATIRYESKIYSRTVALDDTFNAGCMIMLKIMNNTVQESNDAIKWVQGDLLRLLTYGLEHNSRNNCL